MNSVVYYPYLTPDLNWLKLSSLCWDNIYVLHPGNSIPFPQEIENANNDLGRIIKPLDTQMIGSSEDIFAAFLNFLEKKGKRINTNQISDSNEDIQLFRFFPGKLPPSLYEKLMENDLIIYEGDKRTVGKKSFFSIGGESKSFIDIDSFKKELKQGESKLEFLKRMRNEGRSLEQKDSSKIYLPSEVALYYLSLCASKAATIKKADLYGANDDFFDTTINSSNRATVTVMQNIVNAYVPENLNELTPKAIGEIREELAEKRLLFQSEIQSLSKKLADISSEDDLETLKRRIENIARNRINETQKSFRDNKIKLVLKSIGISLTPPALAGYIASALSIGILEPVGIGLSIALFSGNTILEYNKAKSDYNNNAWSYIIDLKKKLH